MELDVHILVMSYTPHDVVNRCLDSVNNAAVQAGFPVNVHVLDGEYGHLGRSRKRGYSLGDSKYVTHVDDDDWVDSDAFYVLASHLNAGAEAVTTGERLHVRGLSKDTPESRHHLAVFAREYVNNSDYHKFRFYPDQRLLSGTSPTHVPMCVYNHVIHDSGSRRCRAGNKRAADEEFKLINDRQLMTLELATSSQIARMIDEEMDDG